MNFEQRKKEEFNNWWKNKGCMYDDGVQVEKKLIWSFFSQSLSDYKKELGEEMEGMKTYNRKQDDLNRILVGDDAFYYNQGIADAISLLQKDKENNSHE